jgi:pimeloyl-ACP methyl ester carboxylesterase
MEETGEALRISMFPYSKPGIEAFLSYWARVSERAVEPLNLEFLPMAEGGDNQMSSIFDALIPNPKAAFDRLGELSMPVLVANGDNDVLVPPSLSWELLTQIKNAQLIIYPKSGHGFIWQYAQRFAEDIHRFLDGVEFD